MADVETDSQITQRLAEEERVRLEQEQRMR